MDALLPSVPHARFWFLSGHNGLAERFRCLWNRSQRRLGEVMGAVGGKWQWRVGMPKEPREHGWQQLDGLRRIGVNRQTHSGAGRIDEYARHRQDCAGSLQNIGKRLSFPELKFRKGRVSVKEFVGLPCGSE
jgi:hypothetical protein